VVGRVAAPYGVRGWLKVVPYTATADALLRFPSWRMTVRGEQAPREFRLIEGRVHGAAVVAQVEGVVTPEQAAGLRGATVEVPREALPRTGEGEVYLADLPGCQVVNTKGVALGIVQVVEGFGAHPLLRVREAGGTERLIPLVPALVNEVDLEARVIEVDWEADY
jgi:16S rRNA processing protein RimM